MRLASYNVENLFNRAKIMNQPTSAEVREILKAFADLNALLGQVNYTDARKQQMVALIEKLGLTKSDESEFVRLRRNRGSLLKRPQNGPVTITADGRADWAGSLELKTEPIDEEAMRNTARVLNEVNADVVGVVEAESRPALCDFNAVLIGITDGTPYKHIMLIDGNDRRGIDVGLMTRQDFHIRSISSHVDDVLSNGSNFSRDCPVYQLATPNGLKLALLILHLKSKGFGSQASNDAKRKAEALRVKEIYEELRSGGHENIAIVGDFNDTPNSAPLQPLLADTDLQDVFTHPNFDDGGFPGTFGLSNANQKIDYILLSPELAERVDQGGVFRKGMWPGSRPARWEVFPELQAPAQAASDHAAVWVDLRTD